MDNCQKCLIDKVLTCCYVETEPVRINGPNGIRVTPIESLVHSGDVIPGPQSRVLATRDQVISAGNEGQAVHGTAVTTEYPSLALASAADITCNVI